MSSSNDQKRPRNLPINGQMNQVTKPSPGYTRIEAYGLGVRYEGTDHSNPSWNNGQQQNQFFQGVTHENGTYGFSGNAGNEYNPEFEPMADNRMYDSNSQQSQGYVADRTQVAYEYSNNFAEFNNQQNQQYANTNQQFASIVNQMANPNVAFDTNSNAVSAPLPTALLYEPKQPIAGRISQSNKNDPEYKERRAKNNEAAQKSRKKKKCEFDELKEKCARKKDKIKLLKEELKRAIESGEMYRKRYDIVQAALTTSQQSERAAWHEVEQMRRVLDGYKSQNSKGTVDDEVQIITRVAMPSGQGFGTEQAQVSLEEIVKTLGGGVQF